MRNVDATRPLSDLSSPGRRAAVFPQSDVPDRKLDDLIPARFRSKTLPPLPEVTEPDVVRHFVNLSTKNMCCLLYTSDAADE